MPVPVPPYSRPPTHPADKLKRHSDPTRYTTLHTSYSFDCLDTQRSASHRPHRIWEEELPTSQLGFPQGLTTAANAGVIKGARAQACLPPATSLARRSQPHIHSRRHSSGNMTHRSIPARNEDETGDTMNVSPIESYDKIFASNFGAFSPVLEDPSPDANQYDSGSSPIGPITPTPFGDFIDRAITSGYIESTIDPTYLDLGRQPHNAHHVNRQPQYGQVTQIVAKQSPRKQVPAIAAPPPTATSEYKKLVDPLSEWLACYVWRVCSTGAGLPSHFVRPSSFPQRFQRAPPAHLAASIRSLLLSTLLQPSAIFLSLWYIVRLPVYIGSVSISPELIKEYQFRLELFGEDERPVETHAPFRVFLLGCMLANKWLDDHTFSNKTWQSISHVPVRLLNRLESSALAIFFHDLTISPQQWVAWLSHLSGYHSSLSSAAQQPIGRPSANPHLIIKKALEELLHIPIETPHRDEVRSVILPPGPVFIGLEERRREHAAKEAATEQSNNEILDIDLDEDGPLREEYLPKRRVSNAGDAELARIPFKPIAPGRTLPPPAKWSPEHDEPIMWSHSRPIRPYLAPQPPPKRQHVADPIWGSTHEEKYEHAFGYGYDPLAGAIPPTYDYRDPYLGHSRSQLHGVFPESVMPPSYGYGPFAPPENYRLHGYHPEPYGRYHYPYVGEAYGIV